MRQDCFAELPALPAAGKSRAPSPLARSRHQRRPSARFTPISILAIVSGVIVPSGGYSNEALGTVVTESHFAHEANDNPPSFAGIGTRNRNAACSTLVTGTTHTSSAWRFNAFVEMTTAGRSLSTRAR